MGPALTNPLKPRLKREISPLGGRNPELGPWRFPIIRIGFGYPQNWAFSEPRLAIISRSRRNPEASKACGKRQGKRAYIYGQNVDSKEALEIGLVNKVCAPDALIDECKNMAAMICETGPVAIEQAKYAINYGLETDLHTGLALESNAYWVTIPTKDRLEGLAAFKEKRKPVYKGE